MSDTEPGHTAPGHSAPGHTAPGHTPPGHTAPGHRAQGHTAPRVTGVRETTDDAPVLVLQRTFDATPEEVWAACTEPRRLERWIGTWDGDPAEGHIAFRMTAEGDDVAPERYDIEICEPPRRLLLRSATTIPCSEPSLDSPAETMTWVLGLTVTAEPGVGPPTTLTFTQVLESGTAGSVAASVGPGWEYYLDRLQAAMAGTDVLGIRWEDYLSGAERYRAMFS